MRLGGLISGVDTETLISAMMELERTRLYRQEIKQAELEQKQKAWQQVRTALTTIQTKADQLRWSSLFRSRTVELSDPTVATVSAESGAAQTSYTLKVVQLAQSHVVASSQTWASGEPLNLEGTFYIGSGTDATTFQEVHVEATDTLSSLAAKINALDSGVLAYVTTTEDGTVRLVLTSAKSGASNAINVSLSNESLVVETGADEPNILESLGLTPDDWEELSEAQDAIVYLNGKEYKSSDNTFDNILPGIKITVKKPTGDSVVSMTVSADIDKMVQAVKDWVDAVNSLQDLLKQLSAYDTESNTGAALFGENLVRSIQFGIRKVFSEKIDDLPASMNMLAHIGVSMGAYNTSDFGKIVVDETKLREALQRDPEGVTRLFQYYKPAETDETGKVVKPEQKGFARAMYDYIKSLFDIETGAVQLREQSIKKQMGNIKQTIERLEYQLKLREEALRRQFEQLEEAMSALQSQGNYLLMQLYGAMLQSS